MFKDIISRDDGAPWGTTGLTSATWHDVAVREVCIADLIATQSGVFFDKLINAHEDPVGGDPFPHVVSWQGALYLEDGHHRVMRNILAGARTVVARVLEL